jgi:hypothetical protein
MHRRSVEPVQIALRFRPELAGRLDVLDDDGAVLASTSLAPGTFEQMTLTYIPSVAGKSCLTFRVLGDVPGGAERVLLFSQLEIRGGS